MSIVEQRSQAFRSFLDELGAWEVSDVAQYIIEQRTAWGRPSPEVTNGSPPIAVITHHLQRVKEGTDLMSAQLCVDLAASFDKPAESLLVQLQNGETPVAHDSHDKEASGDTSSNGGHSRQKRSRQRRSKDVSEEVRLRQAAHLCRLMDERGIKPGALAKIIAPLAGLKMESCANQIGAFRSGRIFMEGNWQTYMAQGLGVAEEDLIPPVILPHDAAAGSVEDVPESTENALLADVDAATTPGNSPPPAFLQEEVPVSVVPLYGSEECRFMLHTSYERGMPVHDVAPEGLVQFFFQATSDDMLNVIPAAVPDRVQPDSPREKTDASSSQHDKVEIDMTDGTIQKLFKGRAVVTIQPDGKDLILLIQTRVSRKAFWEKLL